MSEHQVSMSASSNYDSGKTIALVVYILQAAGFFIGLTFIVGAIINYVKRGDVKGTWLESHFKWQLRTFWFGILWNVIGVLTIVFTIGYLILAINFFWMIYRIVKGFIRLNDRKSMYNDNVIANVTVNVTSVTVDETQRESSGS